MRQNRVIGIALIWSPHTSASGNRHTVIWSCTSLSIHQIIITILFVKVRSFRPDHMMHGTFPDFFAFTNKLHGLQIKFLNPYLPVPIITNSVLLVWSCSYIIAMNCSIFIFVKEQTGINPRSIFIQIIRIRPGTLRAFSSYNKIVSMWNICCNHVIASLKIPQGRCIDSPGMSGIFQMELWLSGKHMTDLLPVSQIFAVINRNTRKISKAWCYKIIIISHSADGRIRTKTR